MLQRLPGFIRMRASGKLVAGLAIVLTLLIGCGDGESSPDLQADTAETGQELPAKGASLAEEGACVNGWTKPDPGTPPYERPLEIIRRTMGIEGDFDVEEMRYFVGPESPPSDKNYLATVRRWYVKAALADDPSFRGRWLVEARRFGSGVAAVAPYETTGFKSPEWTAFQHETVGPEAERRRYPGLPGEWSGLPYDFVTGEEPDEDIPGEALTIPGLPSQVTGCLAGT